MKVCCVMEAAGAHLQKHKDVRHGVPLMMSFEVHERGWREMRLRMCQRLFFF